MSLIRNVIQLHSTKVHDWLLATALVQWTSCDGEVSIDDLAHVAGITPAAVREHFSSGVDLQIQLLARVTHCWTPVIEWRVPKGVTSHPCAALTVLPASSLLRIVATCA